MRRLVLYFASSWSLLGRGSADDGRCRAEQLPEDCINDDNKMDFEQFLIGACKICPPGSGPVSKPCHEDESNAFADLALSIVMRGPSRTTCIAGYFAAYLVTVQYSSSRSPLEISEDVVKVADEIFEGSSGFDLFPYPFWSQSRPLGAQIRFFARFSPSHLHHCEDEPQQLEVHRGTVVLRASHTKPELELACASRSSDFQLVKRCREKRRAQHHRGMEGYYSTARIMSTGDWPRQPSYDLGSIECPDQASQDAFASRHAEKRKAIEEEKRDKMELKVAQAKNKYTKRATAANESYEEGLGCEGPQAEWVKDLSMYHKCILVVVFERLRLAPGALVLDWGSGCGHKLSWASQLFGVQPLGLDVVAENVAWATAHSAGKYCHVDGRFVDWIPNDSLDGIISYAALAHLDPIDQCDVVVGLMGKLRIGGRAWFGWNAPGIWHNETELEKQWMLPAELAWSNCFDRALSLHPRWRTSEVEVMWEAVDEAYLFPPEYTATDTYLYWHPAYSLFLTRVPHDIRFG